MLYKKSEERVHSQHKKHATERRLPTRKLEEKQREEGLAQPLDETNKGFKMLQKMSFGGSTSALADKLRSAEPLKIEVKNDSLGLGKKTADTQRVRELIDREMAKKRVLEADFLDAKRSQLTANQTFKDLIKSQICCHQLDDTSNLSAPIERWFWPRAAREPLDKPEDIDEETYEDPEADLEQIETAEKLQKLTDYLRDTYSYCIWCGTRFDSSEDMTNSCPGATRISHDE